MSSLTNPEVISGLSMLVAFATIIIGPVVTFKIAKRQIISPIRQKWIDELRELMCLFLSESHKVIIISEGDGLLNVKDMDVVAFQKMLYMEQKLRLMLNPNEADHVKLIEFVKSITEDVQHGGCNLIQFSDKIGGATELSQKILKSEWSRVKQGEI